ncbi:hypothetical protein BDK88_4257 [Natrinema hispanicum]|uniref:Uncharacterized protein n=1 Tax=Natrinema hispanicum TaxID=392421 RepID=A0A482Y1P2_9EURY|nr:hypothetical protein BDK88_4257 [Natrinema hispanicum]
MNRNEVILPDCGLSCWSNGLIASINSHYQYTCGDKVLFVGLLKRFASDWCTLLHNDFDYICISSKTCNTGYWRNWFLFPGTELSVWADIFSMNKALIINFDTKSCNILCDACEVISIHTNYLDLEISFASHDLSDVDNAWNIENPLGLFLPISRWRGTGE